MLVDRGRFVRYFYPKVDIVSFKLLVSLSALLSKVNIALFDCRRFGGTVAELPRRAVAREVALSRVAYDFTKRVARPQGLFRFFQILQKSFKCFS